MKKISVYKADNEELKAKAFAVRQEVFVVEQKVSREDEFDEFEEGSQHFVALTEDGTVAGAARWRQTDHGVKLERFAVKKSMRGSGVGTKLVDAVLMDVKSKLGAGNLIYLHAQLEAIPLYEKFGFQKKGDIFSECDILHYKMELHQ